MIEEANKALSWLDSKQQAQAGLRKTDAPLLVSGDIKKRQDTLTRFAEPIMSKPAPLPPVRCHRFPLPLSVHRILQTLWVAFNSCYLSLTT